MLIRASLLPSYYYRCQSGYHLYPQGPLNESVVAVVVVYNLCQLLIHIQEK